MAAPWENLLSFEHLTSMDQNTFTKQRELFIKKSRGMQLQQRLQELKARERRAQQHNRQLLLQFERAQDTLKEMLARNAAMKTIRVEYELYLEENLHRWQQQLQEKTEASHKKRMEDCLKSYLQHSKDQVSTATVDQPLISQDPFIKAPKVDAPQTFLTEGSSAYSQHRFSCYPHQEPTWLTQAGMPPGFLQTPFQPQCPSPFPPPNFPYPHPLLLQHLTPPFDHHRPWVRSEAVGRAPERYSHPCSDGIAVGSAGQLHTEEPPASHIVERENETSAANSKRVRGGGGGRCLSSELDIKPVRLSSGHVKSSESGRDSSLTCRDEKKREKKGRTEASSSESERPSSQRSSRTSSEVVAASCAVALDSETSCSSGEGGTASKGRSERGRGVNTGSPPSEKEAEELSTRSPAQDNKSGSCKGDDIAKSENRDDEEVYSSEQSIAEEKDEEEGKKYQRSVDEEKEKEVKSEVGGDVEEDDESNNEVLPNRNQKENEEDEEEYEDQSEKLENESRDDGEKDSDSSQDDEEREGSENIEEEESNEEEDQLRSEEAGDSEDSIICLQENSHFASGLNR
ncbi:chromodomain-helicase-DNA-binding protein 7 isoform X2 [Poecilia reticulata]|uniref:chromodomain-helicase-DNA-binding protein 7 isoform X2 n=1 Tax=Poecilia reticulata TaxID=8081 RepID=UPI0004A25189|nr:PREDICTED: chromodomain-helicase-DNA-binding protein 7-like isoform X2 [Poecilia reticulata]